MTIILKNDFDKQMALKCLKASMDTDFFPDWEFPILFGLEKSEVLKIINNWESVDFEDDTVQIAIQNAMNHLIGYPHGQEKKLESILGISMSEFAEIYKRLLNINEINGRSYFESIK